MKEIDYRLIGACGLYCGECDIYLAFKNNDQKLKEEIAKAHNLQSSYVHCDGCWGDFSKIWGIEWQENGKACKIRKCTKRHHIHVCMHACKEVGMEKWLKEKQK